MNEEEIQKVRSNNQHRSTIIIKQENSGSNVLGIIGFIFALLALLLCWIPFLNWILWLPGIILSFVGLFSRPKGLAIAGFVISCLALIPLVLMAAFIAALAVS